LFRETGTPLDNSDIGRALIDLGTGIIINDVGGGLSIAVIMQNDCGGVGSGSQSKKWLHVPWKYIILQSTGIYALPILHTLKHR
jgi:hypothetical protein